MSKMKTVLMITVGVGAGMAIANYLTDGAVLDAATATFNNVKDRVASKTADVAETITEEIPVE